MSRRSPSYQDYGEPAAGFDAEQQIRTYYDDRRQPYNHPPHESRGPHSDLTYQEARGLNQGRFRESHVPAEQPRRISPTPEPVVPPEPSAEYLDTSQLPSAALEDPRTLRKLLILDLNGTLLYRSAHNRRAPGPYQPSKTNGRPALPPWRQPDPHRNLRPVHPRPFMPTFREYLFHPVTRQWLDTMVWSSAQPHSVDDMVNKAFEQHREGLVAVWARDTLGLSSRDYNKKSQTLKDIAKPWSALNSDDDPNSVAREEQSAQTTLLLDDSPLKAQLQPWNHVCIPEYVSEIREKDLRALRAGSSSEGVDSTDPLVQLSKAERKAEQARRKTERNRRKKAEKKASKLVADANAEAKEISPGASPDPPETSRQDTPDVNEDGIVGSKRKIRDSPPHAAKKLKESFPHADEDHLDIDIDHLPPYDNTLLAVIGILEALKSQSNVSSWIRTGGLFGLPNVISEDNLEHASAEDSIPSSSQPDAPPASSSPLLTDAAELGPEDEEVSQPKPLVKMWFEEDATVEFWAKRGLEALLDLEVPLIHGVKDYQ